MATKNYLKNNNFHDHSISLRTNLNFSLNVPCIIVESATKYNFGNNKVFSCFLSQFISGNNVMWIKHRCTK